MLAIDVEVDKNQISSGAQSTSPFDFFKNIFREKTDTQQAAKSQQVQRSVLSERPTANLVEAWEQHVNHVRESTNLSFSHDKENTVSAQVPFKSREPLSTASKSSLTVKPLKDKEFAGILQDGGYPSVVKENLNFYRNSREVTKNSENEKTLSFVLKNLSDNPELKREFISSVFRSSRNSDISNILQDFKSKMLAQQNAAVKS